VRANQGTYYVNVARRDRVETLRIDQVELLNPTDPAQATTLHAALAQATEIATCLPSVNFYDSARDDSVAALIAAGLQDRTAEATIVYAAENHNHAAEILEQAVAQRLQHGTGIPSTSLRAGRLVNPKSVGQVPISRVQFLNTVIGKMSQVVTDPTEIAARGLAPIAPGIHRAFLVEEFNHILVSKTMIPDFTPASRSLLRRTTCCLLRRPSFTATTPSTPCWASSACSRVHEDDRAQGGCASDECSSEAFLRESGGALVRKYASLGDELFTEAGYRLYADDLLERMTNPHLADTVARAGRDVVRKLGIHDRIFGTMALAFEYGIEPRNMALGALAGIALLLANAAEYGVPAERRSLNWRHLRREDLRPLLTFLWQSPRSPLLEKLAEVTCAASEPLAKLLARQ